MGVRTPVSIVSATGVQIYQMHSSMLDHLIKAMSPYAGVFNEHIAVPTIIPLLPTIVCNTKRQSVNFASSRIYISQWPPRLYFQLALPHALREPED
jgi:hypothetical protein